MNSIRLFCCLLGAALAGCSGPEPLADLGSDRGPGDGSPAEARPGDSGPDGSSSCASGAALIGRVEPARMLRDLESLVGLGERRSATAQAKAAAYLKKQLDALGLSVRTLEYAYNGASYQNIEATLPGEQADRFVFVGAHFDSYSKTPGVAPGADDNASGTVAVLEMARALQGCRPQRTVRFLFFSNEEVGTIGSIRYLEAVKAELPASSLLGYLNLDMIGFARPGEDLDLATRPAHAALVDQVAASVSRWTSLPVKKVINDQCG